MNQHQFVFFCCCCSFYSKLGQTTNIFTLFGMDFFSSHKSLRSNFMAITLFLNRFMYIIFSSNIKRNFRIIEKIYAPHERKLKLNKQMNSISKKKSNNNSHKKEITVEIPLKIENQIEYKKKV